MRTAVVVALAGLSAAAAFGLALDGAGAQTTKPKPKAQPTGQMICNSSVGCRPVRPGCRIEPSNYVGQVEVCPGQKRPD
jgi:hypothetical protein